MMSTLRAEYNSERIMLYRSGWNSALLTQCAMLHHRPFIHPILAPDGVGELTENQPEHHAWQHGLYTGLNDVNGVGFWTEGLLNSSDHDGTFHPRPLTPPVVTVNRAYWDVITDWRSPQGLTMLTETQQWSMEDCGDSLALDLKWELLAATNLRFGEYSYGGLFLRMPWRVDIGSSLLTSEGAVTPRDAEGKRARWVALAMPIPGRAIGVAGIALLDHPSNPEHPTPWRVDDHYGISPSRCIASDWHLEKESITISRYRIFVFIGGISQNTIEAEWQQFATA